MVGNEIICFSKSNNVLAPEEVVKIIDVVENGSTTYYGAEGYVSIFKQDMFLTDFSEALNYVKNGWKITRKGWNGKGLFVFMDPGHTCAGYKEYTGESLNEVKPFFIIANKNILNTWVPSISDILAEDWMVVKQ